MLTKETNRKSTNCTISVWFQTLLACHRQDIHISQNPGKAVLKVFVPVRFGDDFHIRTKKELYDVLFDMDLVQRINIQRLS